MKIIETMRWYGPQDTVSLADLKQAGCTGVVNALHQIAVGEIWPMEAILERKEMIENAGLHWAVVESLPVHDDIKKRNGNYLQYLANYKVSLQHLANCGIKVITYNFMPVLDWMRTNLKYKVASGATALRFEKVAFIAFDVFLLARPGAAEEYTAVQIEEAEAYLASISEEEKSNLMSTCLQALPGSTESFTPQQVLHLLNEYKGLTADILRANLVTFLEEITPLTDELGMQMVIHPDDPPYAILGLPRIMSTEADAQYILDKVPNKSNGICFCSGSFGARPDNDLPGMIKRLGSRIYFLHLRSTQRDENGNFYEANHLEGNANMVALMKEIVLLMQKENRAIPMRPDHGHEMMDDVGKKHYPGYSAIGRLKGLAELRGLEMGIRLTMEES